MNEIVDCHVHLPVGRARPLSGASTPEPARILDEIREVGIDRAVCFPSFAPDPDNQALADFASRRKDVIPFAWLNPYQDGHAELLRMLVDQHGFRGVKLHPLLHGYPANTSLLDPIMDVAAELQLPVLVHSGHPMTATPWQVAGLAERHPAVSVIMEHMGLQLSWVDDAIELGRRHPNLVLGLTAMPYFRKIREAVDAVGHDRVVWGSDAPGLDAASELLRVRRSGLSADEEAAVLGRTILRLTEGR